MTRLSFTVIGVPAPQGSKRFIGHPGGGRGFMVESSKNVKPWREAVANAARDAYSGPPLDGPLGLGITFRLPRPKSAKKVAVWHITQPDCSKLLRSTEDALKTAGMIVDDSRLCDFQMAKVLADRFDPWTGATILLWQIEAP